MATSPSAWSLWRWSSSYGGHLDPCSLIYSSLFYFDYKSIVLSKYFYVDREDYKGFPQKHFCCRFRRAVLFDRTFIEWWFEAGLNDIKMDW